MQNENDRKLMICPLNGQFCSSGVRKDFPEDATTGQKFTCRWWVHVAGEDPQTRKQIDHFDCSLSWMPILMIENSQMTRFVAASVDKTANEVRKVRKHHTTFVAALNDDARIRLSEYSPKLIEKGSEQNE